MFPTAFNITMTRRKPTQDRTGCISRISLKEEQEKYRHNHGLCTVDVTLHQRFQVEMTTSDYVSNVVCSNITDLLYFSLMVKNN